MRTKKRYLTEIEILRDIGRIKEKHQRLLDMADAYEIQADEMARIGLSEDARFKRKEMDKIRKQANALLKNKMVRAKEKLSEFRTQILPGIGISDPSVQA